MSGPVKRAGGIVVEQDDQGRYVHTFRQSSLGELDLCLERGRLTMAGEMPPDESDAAAVGTSVHAGIEHGLHALKDGQYRTLEEMQDVAQAEFTRIMGLDGFRFVKYIEKGCRALIDKCLVVFYDEVYDTIDPLHIELPFDVHLVEDEHRVIRITGTIDLVDRRKGMLDWKTDGQGTKFKRGFGGKAWELDRWGIQPTVYTAALRAMGIIDPDGPWPFHYGAFALGAQVEYMELTVLRQAADIEWLKRKTGSYCEMVEADMGAWPMNDNHALCSPKWCPAWDLCKGASYVDLEWPLKPAKV
jgi:hypothetical protein